MFSYFNILKNGKKGQIFPLLIAVIVILTIAALISANLGKVSLDRLGCINGADAGAAAGISAFTSGYNKITTLHKIMTITFWYLTAVFLIPVWIWCYPIRHLSYILFRTFNGALYFTAKPIIQIYSDAARQDAYYYALINANIDDPYKEDGRRYPSPGETWSDWVNLKSAFNNWLNRLPQGWERPASLTYNWLDESKWVRVSCASSPTQPLEAKNTLIGGIYLIPIGSIVIPLWIPHGRLFRGFEDPPTRFVNITVERNYQQQEKDLGFWRALQPGTRASASARMTGGYWGGFDYTLN